MRSQDEAYSTRREPLLRGPYPWRDMQAIERPVKEDGPLVDAIVKHDLEAAAGGDEKLVAFLMGMGSSGLSSRYVVCVEDTLYIERDIDVPVNRSDVTSPVCYLRQFDERAVIYIWFVHALINFLFNAAAAGFSKYRLTSMLPARIITANSARFIYHGVPMPVFSNNIFNILIPSW